MTELSILFKRAKTGKVTQKRIWTGEEDGVACIYRESGYVNGKLNTKKKFVRKGTNIGKSNERNPMEQAEFVMGTMWQTDVDHNYCESVAEALKPWKYVFPMLAKTIDKKKLPELPVYVQPKLNGMCAMRLAMGVPEWNYAGHTDLMSRERNILPVLSNISAHLADVVELSYNTHGEVYKHGEELQDIVGACKRHRPLTDELEYWVYDIPIQDVPFKDRLTLLANVIPENHAVLKRCPTHLCETWDEVEKWRAHYIGLGFEGIIIRIPDGLYSYNDRSKMLLKDKDFEDAEFIIEDYDYEEFDDNGTLRKLVIWICRANEKETFRVRPKGNVANKENLYENAAKQVGKPYTVRYLELSKTGVPIGNPVGECIRDYE